MVTARAWAPGHITGFFTIADADSDPLERGSLGAGVSVSAGVTTAVRLNRSAPPRTLVSLNGQPQAAPVSRRVVDFFLASSGLTLPGSLEISHRIDVPQGAGFGSSGAGALSLALALNAALGGPLSPELAAQTAHRAEVECRTGLGTVLSCTVGGLEVRTRAGAPGRGIIRSFAVPTGRTVVSLVKGPLSTASALADAALRGRINAAGERMIDDLLADPNVDRFLELAGTFTAQTGLATPAVRDIISRLSGLGLTSAMHMFGEAVFTILNGSQRPLVSDLQRLAEETGFSLFVIEIAAQGGKVIP